MNALSEALEVGKHQERLYDGPMLKRIIAGLVQLIVTERKDHARELREVVAELA
jgi:hypothetical protein